MKIGIFVNVPVLFYFNIFFLFLFLNYVYHKSKTLQFILPKIIMFISSINAFIYFILHGEIVFITQNYPLFKSRWLPIRMKNCAEYVSFKS